MATYTFYDTKETIAIPGIEAEANAIWGIAVAVMVFDTPRPNSKA